jgi:hypothetical protein
MRRDRHKSARVAHCIYRTREGLHVHCTNTLTDDEVHAYRLHPQTFFGVVKDNVNREAKTVIELFDFMFETYQHTSKEKLLEFLAGMPNYQQLVK